MVMTEEESSSLAKDRSNRIKRLRKALRFSRQKLTAKYKKYGLSTSALQNWEDIRWKGLTENGAIILSKAFQEEGLNVTIEWLLFGVGKDPIGDTDYFTKIPMEIANPSEHTLIAKELRLFHQNNPESIDAVITDDSLAPWLTPGDYVAGKRYFENDMEKTIGHPCILQTLSGETLIRFLKAGKDLEYYTLVSTNAETTVAQPILENIQLFSAAPILWIRKLNLK